MSAAVLDKAQHSTWSAAEMRGLVVSEFRKTLATSAWWALLIPGVLLAVGVLALRARDEYVAFSVASASAWASLFAVLFGAVCASAEYRHNTIATSYLSAANRPKLVAAKMTCAAVVGAIYGVVCAAAAVAAVPLTGTAYGNEWPWILAVSAGAAVVFALWAVLGVGLGTLLRSQVGTVVCALLYVLLIEPIIGTVFSISGWDRVSDYLPDRSATLSLHGLTGGEQFGGQFGVATPWWLMLLVAAGYAAVFIVAGIAAAQRRDIA
jgi:ABC-2 type transport system permease protein